MAFLFPFAGWKKLTWITRLSQQMKFFECKTHTNSFWLYCCLVVIIVYLFNQALWPLWGCFSLFFKFCVRKKLWRHWRRQYQRFFNETLCYSVFWKKDKVFSVLNILNGWKWPERLFQYIAFTDVLTWLLEQKEWKMPWTSVQMTNSLMIHRSFCYGIRKTKRENVLWSNFFKVMSNPIGILPGTIEYENSFIILNWKLRMTEKNNSL